MEYLLVMSLSGTTVVCVCILLKYLMKGRIPVRLQYLLLKISILYYLIPLPFIKEWYRKIVMEITGIRYHGVMDTSGHRSYQIAHVNGSTYINNYMKMQFVAVTVWILISLFLFLIDLYDYFKKRKTLINYINNMNVESEVRTVKRGRGYFRLTQKVTVYYVLPDRRTMALGLLKPVILCGIEPESREAQTVLEHEMTHIKRLDVFWKILLRLVVILHWWNPAVWFLNRNLEWACECSCDEVVLYGKTKDEMKAYMILLVNESKKNRSEENRRVRWGMGLEGEMTRLTERIENAMNMKKWNKAVILLIAVSVLMVNSLTVFAYPKVTDWEGEWTSDEQAKGFINTDLGSFIPDGADKEELQNDITYDDVNLDILFEKQFIDVDGNIYLLQNEVSTNAYKSCNHEYESGKVSKHNKGTDGSCTVSFYSSKRCSLCGNVEIGNRLYVISFDICPH